MLRAKSGNKQNAYEFDISDALSLNPRQVAWRQVKTLPIRSGSLRSIQYPSFGYGAYEAPRQTAPLKIHRICHCLLENEIDQVAPCGHGRHSVDPLMLAKYPTEHCTLSITTTCHCSPYVSSRILL